jgi:thiamine biosynthesis protein ThiS
MNMMLNGVSKETSAGTIQELLTENQLLPTQVAVELNGTVLFRHEYEQTTIKEGDRIEIVRVVAGG